MDNNQIRVLSKDLQNSNKNFVPTGFLQMNVDLIEKIELVKGEKSLILMFGASGLISLLDFEGLQIRAERYFPKKFRLVS